MVGPTAAGKTSFSIRLAQALGGAEKVEIISADAFQLYRGMNIGTAKITAAEAAGIKHHQIDVLDISQAASVGAYQKFARIDLANILQEGNIPIVVGGSGLYVSALLDQLNFPGSFPEIRIELEQRFAVEGLPPLLAELKSLDELSYQKVARDNPRRVIRALEVVRGSGKSFIPEVPRFTSAFEKIKFFGVTAQREILAERIYHRVTQMFVQGFPNEVAALLEKGLSDSPTAYKATGYQQVARYLSGELTREEAIFETSFQTRRLAKKQLTWFRADSRIEWLDLSDDIRNGSDEKITSVLQELGTL
ncbi:MAG: tRNA (adenosine(37)-N6)-dimethylallyltransferase MiaA [Arcanobacterium sp.]|nr:tRNA (adenosine(37)-N6)-dimethylallyltransferase MiaA [Arcanobacterium sp.]